ncbi:MAG: hypothetical protein K1X94_02885 [Sandaracinaceae bacterium]|nr:hypothetical protein [Sandaracinaceae bacterium]
MARASLLLVLAGGLALVTTGCPSEPPVDTPDAYRVRRDTGPVEDDAAGDDAGPELDAFDPALDAFRGPDAFVEPDATFGPPVDAGPCGAWDEDTGLSRCDCIMLGPDCAADPCPTGLTCVSDGCGMHCQTSGDACSVAGDCPSGSSCTDTPLGRVCVRTEPGCASSRDCPLGFSCDAGACVDRRIGCTASDFDTTCPFNFVCDNEHGAPFCVRGMPRCQSDVACRTLFTCTDVEGDGARECVGPGLCDALSDCSAGMTCGVEPSRLSYECLPLGLCRTGADCGGGRTCVDLWGDGQRECVETGGTCSHQTDCPEGALCASPYDGGPPRCLDVPLTI